MLGDLPYLLTDRPEMGSQARYSIYWGRAALYLDSIVAKEELHAKLGYHL